MRQSENKTCPERGRDLEHCWHVQAAAIQNRGTHVAIFPNVCCFCAPSWMHLVVFELLPESQVSNEDLEAQQMSHGHLITMLRAPQQSKLSVVRR